MPTANIVESIVIFDDTESASNPQRKHCDWRRAATGLTFDEMASQRVVLPPNFQDNLLNVGAFDLAPFAMAIAPLVAKPTVYRFGGVPFTANPWAVLAATPAQAATLTVGIDGSVTLSGPGLDPSAALRGPPAPPAPPPDGHPGPGRAANQGFWKVISANALNGIRMQRVSGDEPTGTNETVTLAATSDIQVILEEKAPRWAMMKSNTNAQFSGLRKVLYITDSWVGVEADSTFSPLATLNFDRFTVAPKYIAYVRVECSTIVRVTITDSDITIPHVHELVPPADGALTWYESFEFLTALGVENDFRATPVSVNVIYALR